MFHRIGDRRVNRNTLDVRPGFPGVRPGDDFRAIVAVAQAVEAPLRSGQALHNDFGVFVGENRHYWFPPASATAFCAASSMVRRADHAVGFILLEDGAAFGRVGAVDADDQRRVQIDVLERLDDPACDFIAACDAAENVDQDGLDVVIGVDHGQGVGDDFGIRAAADVEEVGGAAADLLDGIEGSTSPAPRRWR